MFEQAFKNIDNVLWKEAGCTTELDYTEQTSWMLFLKYLDGLEQDLADEAALEGTHARVATLDRGIRLAGDQALPAHQHFGTAKDNLPGVLIARAA
jgi:hypothetical protein